MFILINSSYCHSIFAEILNFLKCIHTVYWTMNTYPSTNCVSFKIGLNYHVSLGYDSYLEEVGFCEIINYSIPTSQWNRKLPFDVLYTYALTRSSTNKPSSKMCDFFRIWVFQPFRVHPAPTYCIDPENSGRHRALVWNLHKKTSMFSLCWP